MSATTAGVIGLLIGLVLGAAAVAVWLLVRRGGLRDELTAARTRATLLDEQTQQHLAEIDRLREHEQSIDEQREVAERRVAAMEEQLKLQQKQFEEQRALLDEAKTKLGEAFALIGSKALAANSEQFLTLAKQRFETLMKEAKGDVEKRQQAIDAIVKPIRELLEKQNAAVGEIEKKREVAYKGIEEQIKHIIESNERLDRETGRLVTALRRPEQRGRWGEMQLRNVVELAGMSARCDFDEQVTIWKGEQQFRPDMVVHLPGSGVIPVDAKVALDAYLDAIQPDADRDALMKRHAEHVATHVRGLANKRYWEGFDDSRYRAPRLVVMFMPIESALMAALEVKHDLHAEAMQNHVLIATPTLLVALLRAVAYGWQQEDVAANAREIAKVGRELYDRLATFVSHFEKVGSGLERATKSYNSAIGSLESRVLPSARNLKELHATTDDQIATPPALDVEVRDVVVEELRSLPERGVDT
jgi:DNA recombination protein RmuC